MDVFHQLHVFWEFDDTFSVDVSKVHTHKATVVCMGKLCRMWAME